MNKAVTVLVTTQGNISSRAITNLRKAGVLVVTAKSLSQMQIMHIGGGEPTKDQWNSALYAISTSDHATGVYGKQLINQLKDRTK